MIKNQPKNKLVLFFHHFGFIATIGVLFYTLQQNGSVITTEQPSTIDRKSMFMMFGIVLALVGHFIQNSGFNKKYS